MTSRTDLSLTDSDTEFAFHMFTIMNVYFLELFKFHPYRDSSEDKNPEVLQPLVSLDEDESEAIQNDIMSRTDKLHNVLQNSINGDSESIEYHIRQIDNERQLEKRPLLPKSAGCLCYVPARYVLLFWSFWGFVNMFTLRMDINIAILAMSGNGNHSVNVEKDNISTHSPLSSTEGSRLTSHNETSQWSETQRNMVLSAFYYGYSSTQILGGYLSGRFGGKRILGLGLLVTSLLALATPSAAYNNYYLLIACRVAQGLSQGLAQPCMHTMWANWAPGPEKSKLMAITYAGCNLGTVIATMASGYVCDMDTLGGWPLIFYIFGGAGVLWSINWLLIVHDKPCQHPRISDQERRYIEQNMDYDLVKKESKPALCQVLRSPALYAIIAAHFANDWGNFALVTCLPSYLHDILKYNITENGVLSSLPFLGLLVTTPLAGVIADSMRKRGILSTKNTRKLMNSIGLFIPSGLILAVCFFDKSREVIVVLLTAALSFTGFTMAGFSVNHLDIAPTFAGVLFGLTNTIGTTTGFIGPAILALLIDGQNNPGQWRIFFYITSGIFFIGALTFLVFAQGEPLNWELSPSVVTTNTSVTSKDDHRTHDDADSIDSEVCTNYSIQSENQDIIRNEDFSESYDDVEWDQVLSHRRCMAETRQAQASSFSQILLSF